MGIKMVSTGAQVVLKLKQFLNTWPFWAIKAIVATILTSIYQA